MAASMRRLTCTRQFSLHFIRQNWIRVLGCGTTRALTTTFSSLLENKYNADEEAILVTRLNEFSKEQLLRYLGDEAKTKKIVALRDGLLKKSHGLDKITQISDLLHINGFTPKILNKFYECLLNETVPIITDEKKIQKLCKPAFKKDSNINTITGLIINTTMVSWAQINKEKEILAWEAYFGNFDRLEPTKLKQHIEGLLGKIPQADAYIMEDMYGKQFQIGSALHTILEMGTEKKPVYFLKTRSVGKIYGLLIGQERISAQETCEKLINNSEITVPGYLLELYQVQKPPCRENLAKSILLVLAFMDTVILRDPKILDKLR